MNENVTRICSLDEIKIGVINTFTIDGEAVLVTKVKDTYQVVNGTCGHMGATLSKGKLVNDETIECPWHHAHYSLENGKVEQGPQLTKVGFIDKLTKYIVPNLHHYETKIIDNSLYIIGTIVKQQVRMKKN